MEFRILTNGLFNASLWISLFLSIHLLPRYYKPWRLRIYGLYVGLVFVMTGPFLIATLFPILIPMFEERTIYGMVILVLFLVVILALLALGSQVFFIVSRGGLWPQPLSERLRLLMGGGSFLILLVTLLRAFYFWFR